MSNTVPYTEFSSAATSGSDFWACSSSCTLTAHVTNATLGVTDFIFSNTISIQGNVQASQFAGKQVSYVWGFDTCSSPNGYATQVVSQIASVDSRGFQDVTSNCPALTNIQHAGTMTLNSDGIITLSLSPQRNFGNLRDSAYYGNFALQLTGNTADSTSSAVSGASSSSSASTIATFSSTGSLSGSSTLTGSQLSNVPPLIPSWAPGQTAAPPGSSLGVGDTPPGGESSSNNKGAIIGGATAGVIIAIIGLAVLFLYLRRKRAKPSEEVPEEHRIVPLSHDESAWGGAPGTSKRVELRPSKHDALRAAEKNPNILGAANATSDEPLVVSSDGVQPTASAESSGRAPSAVFSATGLPAYDAYESANQDPLFLTNLGDQQGPYTLDDTFQVHDLLGEWADEHRDAIPYHLERRLRIGGYTPAIHPSAIAPEVWMTRFAVTRFELAGLIELFERTNGMPTRRIASRESSVADD